MTRERIIHLTRNDFKWNTFRAGGKGGQNQNKRDTGVRCIHPPSGARGEARDGRTQEINKRAAFRRMAESDRFQQWIRIEHAKRVGALDSWLYEQLSPEHLVIEYGPFEDT